MLYVKAKGRDVQLLAADGSMTTVGQEPVPASKLAAKEADLRVNSDLIVLTAKDEIDDAKKEAERKKRFAEHAAGRIAEKATKKAMRIGTCPATGTLAKIRAALRKLGIQEQHLSDDTLRGLAKDISEKQIAQADEEQRLFTGREVKTMIADAVAAKVEELTGPKAPTKG